MPECSGSWLITDTVRTFTTDDLAGPAEGREVSVLRVFGEVDLTTHAVFAAGLGAAVGSALRALNDATAPPPALTTGQLRRSLHAALERLPAAPAALADEAWAATRVACAHLAAGDVREARQSLLAADNALLGQHPTVSTGELADDGLARRAS